MNLKESIRINSREFIALCEAYDVKRLYAFGSSVNGTFNNEESDIDLLVEMDTEDPIQRGQNLLSLWEKFEAFFKRKVDLLTNTSLRNPILKKNIDKTKILIYDGERHKISL
jgi:predicted nucleotidyltransferase